MVELEMEILNEDGNLKCHFCPHSQLSLMLNYRTQKHPAGHCCHQSLVGSARMTWHLPRWCQTRFAGVKPDLLPAYYWLEAGDSFPMASEWVEALHLMVIAFV